MRSKLDEILAQPSVRSGLDDAIVGLTTLAAALAIGQLLELPDRVRELAAGDDGAVVMGSVLLVMAMLLGGLVSALHGLRRLSREHAAGTASPRRAPPGIADRALPHVGNDDDISLVPRTPFQETPRRRVPNVTSEC
jgi:hypothetical protein